MPTPNPLLEALTKASHDSGFLIDELREALHLTPENDPGLSILLLELIEAAAKLYQRTSQIATRYESASLLPEGVVSLASCQDPFLCQGGSVWLLKTPEWSLYCAPLLQGGTGFRPAEAAKVHATDILPQNKIDHIIAALTPLPEDGEAVSDSVPAMPTV